MIYNSEILKFLQWGVFMRNQNSSNWKNKVHGILNICQDELKRTTEIGTKMISASKINNEVKSKYEEIGRLVAKSYNQGEQDHLQASVRALIEKINELESELKGFESQVKNLKARD